MSPCFVISCHADTGFRSHRLRREPGGVLRGHLDNFAGVHAVMRAYFSGGLDVEQVRIELTYGEEIDMAGAREVLETLTPEDVVVVVDVTGAAIDADITIEKCSSEPMKSLVRRALSGFSFELYEGCPDPVSDADECDVYKERLANVFFLGIPCRGGDYNAGAVTCREASIETAAQALVRLARAFHEGDGRLATDAAFAGRIRPTTEALDVAKGVAEAQTDGRTARSGGERQRCLRGKPKVHSRDVEDQALGVEAKRCKEKRRLASQ